MSIHLRKPIVHKIYKNSSSEALEIQGSKTSRLVFLNQMVRIQGHGISGSSQVFFEDDQSRGAGSLLKAATILP